MTAVTTIYLSGRTSHPRTPWLPGHHLGRSGSLSMRAAALVRMPWVTRVTEDRGLVATMTSRSTEVAALVDPLPRWERPRAPSLCGHASGTFPSLQLSFWSDGPQRLFMFPVLPTRDAAEPVQARVLGLLAVPQGCRRRALRSTILPRQRRASVSSRCHAWHS